MNDDMKTPVTIGGTTRVTQPYASPPHRFAMIGDGQAIAIAEDILSNELVPLELRQLCEWVKRRADVPKPLPAGVHVVRIGEPRPEVSDLDLRDRARAAKGLPLRGFADPDQHSTWRDIDADEQTIVVDLELP